MEETATVITVLSVVFGGVISLLIYIWNQTQKANDKRHEKHEQLIEELTKSSIEQKMILAELNTMVKYHERELQGK